MRMTGLDHIVITTADIDKCIAFYAGVLGVRHELKMASMLFTLVCRRLIFTADRQNFCRQHSILHTAVRISACLLMVISAQLKQK